MERVLADAFIVPEESKGAFLEGARRVQSFLKTLPVSSRVFSYKDKDGESRYSFLTTAVWRDQDAVENAKETVALEFRNKDSIPKKRGEN